ncbi:Pentatricopeptide repeat-containing protein [Forsythia ovata]|uniref:Pentatricopeptide repeat-containing protein n=1 Tax=Forsythia ovata TaxID=205694 RepID=A0ABD1XAE2_9LAMI
MKENGFIPSSKSYNSLVNSLALEGKVDEAVKFLLEMGDNQRSADFITYRTVFDEICRQKKVGDAMRLLEELREKDRVDEDAYRKLLCELKDDFRDSNVRIQTQLS